MPLASRRVTDPVALKALAHPVRLALLELLATEGALTASQAAVRIGQSPSNCSWHLRKLAEHGFVRETRGRTGRDRPWQVVREGLSWLGTSDESKPPQVSTDKPPDEPPGQPPARAADEYPDQPEHPDPPSGLAGDAVSDMLVEREVQRLRAARAARPQEPPAWRTATGLVRSQLWLTAAEAAEVTAALEALALRHPERAADPDARPPEVRLVSLVAWVVPAGPPPGRDPGPPPGPRP
jgi:DNA-binding transcriptional ArsR family regulator